MFLFFFNDYSKKAVASQLLPFYPKETLRIYYQKEINIFYITTMHPGSLND